MLNQSIENFSLSSYFLGKLLLVGNGRGGGGGLFLFVSFREDRVKIHGSIITVTNRSVYKDSLLKVDKVWDLRELT